MHAPGTILFLRPALHLSLLPSLLFKWYIVGQAVQPSALTFVPDVILRLEILIFPPAPREHALSRPDKAVLMNEIYGEEWVGERIGRTVYTLRNIFLSLERFMAKQCGSSGIDGEGISL